MSSLAVLHIPHSADLIPVGLRCAITVPDAVQAHELVVGHTLRQLLAAKLERDAARRGGPTERVERGELDADVLDGLRALGYVE